MYDVNDYGRMMADPVRMHAYTEALRRAVKPGCVVVDVGTGTGIFALLAAKFGARKVYAIDTNPCIRLAHDVAKRNGLADRIEFINKSVFDLKLPEKADVVIADCRGAFTLHARNLEIMIRARSFLHPDGTMIPLRDELFVALVDWPSLYEDLEKRWRAGGFDWAACRAECMSTLHVAPDADLAGARFLVDGEKWAVVDYATLSSPNVLRKHVEAEAKTAGRGHFLVLWFVSIATEGFSLGSAPCQNERQVYTPVLLPLDPPFDVAAGETVTMGIDALHNGRGYVFAWTVRGRAGNRRQISEGNAAHVLALNSLGERGTLGPGYS